MDFELVNIMMPAYNAEQYIGQAIESVLAQTYTYWELVVINDGSSDGTADVLARYSDPRIQLLHQANQGEAAARNSALREIQGEYLAFLDADDVYLPHHLEVTVGYLQNHQNRDGVYTDGYYIDQDGNQLKTLSSRRRGPFEGRIFEEVVRGSDVFGPPVCVVLKADIVRRHQLQFDTNIVIGPDWDFFTHYADLAQFGYLDEYTCLYRVHQTNITARIDLQRRALELAKCRMNAIKMENFKRCSLETRTAVFYDLLVNQLRNFPNRQEEIIQSPEFCELPVEVQARLYRLMASQLVVSGGESRYIDEWFHRSRELNPADGRGVLLAAIYNLSPLICKSLLRVKRLGQTDPLNILPFADLKESSS